MSLRARRFFKVVVIGDSGCGKTSLLLRYVNGFFFCEYQATIGASMISKVIEEDGMTMEMQFWDTAGQERFQSLGTSLYRGADACILVFDLCNESSFDNLLFWKNEFLLQTDSSTRLDSPFVLVGTKCDCTEEIDVHCEDVLSWCDSNGIDKNCYFETSAKTGAFVSEAFDCVINMAMKHSFRQNIYSPGVIDITDLGDDRKGCKCLIVCSQLPFLRKNVVPVTSLQRIR